MNTELFWLVLTIILTGSLWVPYIVNRIIENGLMTALRNPKPDEPPKADWANRLMHAHSNAVENLVIFAPLVCLLLIMDVSTPETILATTVYFGARLAHAVIYTLGIPYFRTIAFFTGFLAQMMLAWNILIRI